MKSLYFQLLGIDPHEVVYDSAYFEREVEHAAARSAQVMARSIRADLQPSTVIDVGCGTGALLEALQKEGCQVSGLEYAESALQYCRQRQLDVQKFDIEKMSLTNQPTYDVAISMEVAEHLPETCADRYILLLTGLSPCVVFTAARPGQGGTDHVNEQPASYWMSKFQSRGFERDEILSSRWKLEWEGSGSVSSHYYHNLLIFRRSGAT
jgi:cyclopropane fatty-acyl-phospholipid synthase-like methyltransferase